MTCEEQNEYRRLSFYRHEERTWARAANKNVLAGLLMMGGFWMVARQQKTVLSLILLSGMLGCAARAWQACRRMRRARYRGNTFGEQLKTWTR